MQGSKSGYFESSNKRQKFDDDNWNRNDPGKQNKKKKMNKKFLREEKFNGH